MKNYLIPSLLIVLVATGFAAENPNARPLFNGKDLSGWTGQGFVVEDGAILTAEKGESLVSEGTFSSYALEFDFKLNAGASGGVGIHYPGAGDAAEMGMELAILDQTPEKDQGLPDSQLHGSISKLAAAKKSALKPVGEWNHQK